MPDFTKFYNAGVTLQAGTTFIENIDASGLRVTWDLDRTIEPEPDQGVIRVCNLAPETRKKIELERKQFVPFKAQFMQGWDRNLQLLFFADVFEFTPDDKSDAVNVWSEFKVGDGLEGMRDGIFSQSLGAVDLTTIIELAGSAMNIALGADAKTTLAAALPAARLTQFKNGYAATAPARDVFTEVLGMLKLRWTIQNGQAVLIPSGRSVPGKALKLTPNSGMRNYKTENDGSIFIEALSIPAAVPGKQIVVLDEFGALVAEVAYRIQHVRFFGDTDFGAEMSITARRSLI